MERYAFSGNSKAVYGIGCNDVFSKSADQTRYAVAAFGAERRRGAHTQKQICWDWGFQNDGEHALIKRAGKGGGFVVQSPIRRAQGAFRNADRSGQRLRVMGLKPVYEAEERLFRLYF